ncbi:MAG: tetratricopeptide repeat protein [Vicinamibacterales bacterium]
MAWTKPAAALALCLLAGGGCAVSGQTTVLSVTPGRSLGAGAPIPAVPDVSSSTGKVTPFPARARPVIKAGASAETRDERLAAALSAVATFPTAAGHRAAAEAYLVHGIHDRAFEHYRLAVSLDARDAASYDGMARIWRDWGFPHLGLGDAYRAIYHAPSWAASVNTLGTLLIAMGRRHEAIDAFERALALDPGAGYALNNLCYSLAMAGRSGDATMACRRALDVSPCSSITRQNLAYAYVLAGNVTAAGHEWAAVEAGVTGQCKSGRPTTSPGAGGTSTSFRR